MLDLDGPYVWPSTRQKIGKWAKQPAIQEGYLPIHDAACLMAEEGYAGIWESLSRNTQAEISGLEESLVQSLDSAGRLEGYSAEERQVNGRKFETYPLAAYRDWVRRTGYGDGRYFEERIKREGKIWSKPVLRSNPFQYKETTSRLDPETPKAYVLGQKKVLSVEEFAAFYCGIDMAEAQEVNDWNVWNTHINPLIELIEDSAKAHPVPPQPETDWLDPDVPF